MRTTHLLSLFAATVLGAGCTTLDSDSDQLQEHPGDDHEHGDCGCRIEGADIGQVGAYVSVDGEIYAFESWTAKAGSPDEFIGFVLSANASAASYVVEAGGHAHPGTGVSWSHPGDSGPDAHGISSVDFCGDDADYDEGGDEGEPGDDLPDID